MIGPRKTPRKADDVRLTLLRTIEKGEYVKCKYILSSSNVDVNFKDSEGDTPLVIACICGDVRIVRYLLQVGADVEMTNAKEWTPLLTSVYLENYEVCEVLLKEGLADPNGTNSRGWTALMEAASRGNEHLCWLLLSHGASVSQGLFQNNYNASLVAIMNGFANISFSLLHGNELYTAVSNRDLQSVEALLQFAETYSESFFRVKRHPHICLKDSDDHARLIEQNVKPVEALFVTFSPKKFVNHCDAATGWTSLMLAASLSELVIVDRILRCPFVNVTVTDTNGFSAYKIARQKRGIPILRRLEKFFQTHGYKTEDVDSCSDEPSVIAFSDSHLSAHPSSPRFGRSRLNESASVARARQSSITQYGRIKFCLDSILAPSDDSLVKHSTRNGELGSPVSHDMAPAQEYSDGGYESPFSSPLKGYFDANLADDGVSPVAEEAKTNRVARYPISPEHPFGNQKQDMSASSIHKRMQLLKTDSAREVSPSKPGTLPSRFPSLEYMNSCAEQLKASSGQSMEEIVPDVPLSHPSRDRSEEMVGSRLINAIVNGLYAEFVSLLELVGSSSDKTRAASVYNYRNKHDWSLLMIAANLGRFPMVQHLLSYPEVHVHRRNSYGVTALMCASFAGFNSIVHVLSSKGDRASLNIRDNNGWSALTYAVRRGAVEVVKGLLAAGIDRTLIRRDDGADALRYGSVIERAHMEYDDNMKALTDICPPESYADLVAYFT